MRSNSLKNGLTKEQVRFSQICITSIQEYPGSTWASHHQRDQSLRILLSRACKTQQAIIIKLVVSLSMISLPSTIRQYSMIQAREATLLEFKGLHNSQTVVTCNLPTIPLRKTLVKRRLVASRIAHHQFHSQWAKILLQAKLWAMSSLIQYCQVP